jgi:hypothetical protein
MLLYLVASLIKNRQKVNRIASKSTKVQRQGAEPGCRAKVQQQRPVIRRMHLIR